MADLVRLFDEVEMVKALRDQTIELIHTTNDIHAIKKLIELHDLLHLNVLIQEHFKYDDPPLWDLSALKAINHARVELLLFHQNDLPARPLAAFNGKAMTLLNLVRLRNTRFTF